MTYSDRIDALTGVGVHNFCFENQNSFTATIDVDTNTAYNFLKIAYGIDKVIFNPPATIIIGGGKKTVVKVMDGDEWDAEKGFAICLLKHILGNWPLKKFFKEYVDPQLKKEREEMTEEQSNINSVCEALRRFRESISLTRMRFEEQNKKLNEMLSEDEGKIEKWNP